MGEYLCSLPILRMVKKNRNFFCFTTKVLHLTVVLQSIEYQCPIFQIFIIET